MRGVRAVPGNGRFAMNCHELLKHFKIQKSGASVSGVATCKKDSLAKNFRKAVK
jgi:hypothetical protein